MSAEDERVSSDKAALSPNGRRSSAPLARSDEDIAEAIGRMIAALGRRCSDGDPDTAALLRFLQGELEDAMTDAVTGWRAAGFSDSHIGRELGVTKQAVQQRWPRQRQTPGEQA